jgi:pimeloyl-ACP methyl ester carboxylesterase
MVLSDEAASRPLCESRPDRIFVETELGSECIAYFVTRGGEKQRQAVMFLDGDMSPEKYNNPDQVAGDLATVKKALQAWADKLKVRYVYVSRVGLNGSSGNHGERRRPRETIIMHTAIDGLKARLGLDRIALLGQSGGSTISASLLSLGRRDVACAVLGSGAFEVVDLHHKIITAQGATISKADLAKRMYDPASHVAEIPADPRRRVFIVGDTTDSRTPFDQQVRYANSLRARGHHALLIPVEALGGDDHAAGLYAIPTAGGCLAGTSDAALVKANDGLSRKATASEAKAAVAAATGSAALVKTSLQRRAP